MHKEIHEQPAVIGDTLRLREPGRPSHHPARAAGRLRHPAEAGHGGVRHRVLRLHGRQVLVRAAGRPAGRPGHRLRVPLPRHAARAGSAALFVSQSGETAHARRDAPRQAPRARHGRSGQRARARSRARGGLPPAHACRPEIGVASTKAFTTQLATLACLRGRRSAGARSAQRERERELTQALDEVPARRRSAAAGP